MYEIPIIGAIAVDLDGTPIGIVQAIEHSAEGISVYVFTGEEGEDGAKEEEPPRANLETLRVLAGQKVNK